MASSTSLASPPPTATREEEFEVEALVDIAFFRSHLSSQIDFDPVFVFFSMVVHSGGVRTGAVLAQ